MIGRFSILKSLDLEKIDKNIEIYECETGNVPYLFMNEETIIEMLNECSTYYVSKNNLKSLFPFATMAAYKGYKVFQNDDLEFGEVEIR